MDTFNFLTYFGGKILPNTVYSIDEVDLINALGANPATSRIDEILEFRYGLNPITPTVTGVVGTRTYEFNLGTLNYGEFTFFRYTVLDGADLIRSSRKVERSVDNSTLPENPNQFSPVRSFSYDLKADLGGSVAAGGIYNINEADMLAGFSDPDGNTLAISEYGDPTTIGFPRVTNGATIIEFGSNPPGSRVFQLTVGQKPFSFTFTVTDVVDYYANNAYSATNGPQTVT